MWEGNTTSGPIGTASAYLVPNDAELGPVLAACEQHGFERFDAFDVLAQALAPYARAWRGTIGRG